MGIPGDPGDPGDPGNPWDPGIPGNLWDPGDLWDPGVLGILDQDLGILWILGIRLNHRDYFYYYFLFNPP